MIDLPHDPDILELLPGFCQEWRELLEQRWWPNVHAARDTDGLRRLGHAAKGSFLQFGFPQGGAIGEALVQCARGGDWEAAAGHVDALRDLLAQIRGALEARTNG